LPYERPSNEFNASSILNLSLLHVWQILTLHPITPDWFVNIMFKREVLPKIEAINSKLNKAKTDLSYDRHEWYFYYYKMWLCIWCFISIVFCSFQGICLYFLLLIYCCCIYRLNSLFLFVSFASVFIWLVILIFLAELACYID